MYYFFQPIIADSASALTHLVAFRPLIEVNKHILHFTWTYDYSLSHFGNLKKNCSSGYLGLILLKIYLCMWIYVHILHKYIIGLLFYIIYFEHILPSPTILRFFPNTDLFNLIFSLKIKNKVRKKEKEQGRKKGRGRKEERK